MKIAGTKTKIEKEKSKERMLTSLKYPVRKENAQGSGNTIDTAEQSQQAALLSIIEKSYRL